MDDAVVPFQPEDRISSSTPGEWAERAECRGLDVELADRLFFPGHADFAEAAEAKRICARCPVKAECLEFALATHQQHGIWGGASENERKRMRRRRRLARLA